MQVGATIAAGPEISGFSPRKIVTDNAETLHAVMQSIEACGFELTQTIRNDSTPSSQLVIKSVVEMHVDAVGQEMPAAKVLGVADQVFQLETDGRVVRRNHRSRTHANENVDRHAVADQLAQHPHVRGAAQAAGTQDDGDPYAIVARLTKTRVVCHWSRVSSVICPRVSAS